MQVGFESFGTDLPEDVSQDDLLKVVADYNADPKVRGHGWQMRDWRGILGGG
jgi:5,10-methylene-tetrahydrofolate dehydrogenase/methenyl tetrahydrofolate cyclohydrolase